MSAARYRVYAWALPWGETLRIQADLADARAPIRYEADGSWYTTPYRSADARHRPAEALRLVLAYLGPDYYRDPADDRTDEEILDDIVAEAEDDE
jgi:hypothetical protein